MMDVGCGCGKNTIHLVRLGYVAVGIDSSPNAIALAQRLAAEQHVDAGFAVADATEGSDDYEGGFDVIIDLRCSHLITDPPLRQCFFRNMHSWLSPGGHYFGMQIGFVDKTTAEELVIPEDDRPSWELVLDTPGGPLTYTLRNDRMAALWPGRYEADLREAGFVDLAVEYSHDPGRRPCPHRLLADAWKPQ